MKSFSLVSLLVLSACASSSVPGAPEPEASVAVVRAVQGQDMALKVGQVLEIALQSNPSTGYAWNITQDGQPQLLAIPLPATAPEAASRDGAPPMVGSPVIARWHFRAQEPGRTHIRMVYQRPWQTDVPPVETAEFTVEVNSAE